MEFTGWRSGPSEPEDPLRPVEPKVKAALTRALNKECVLLPYVSGDAGGSGGKRGRGRAAAGEELDGPDGELEAAAEGETEGADEEKEEGDEEVATRGKKGVKQTAVDPLVSVKTFSKSSSKPVKDSTSKSKSTSKKSTNSKKGAAPKGRQTKEKLYSEMSDEDNED